MAELLVSLELFVLAAEKYSIDSVLAFQTTRHRNLPLFRVRVCVSIQVLDEEGLLSDQGEAANEDRQNQMDELIHASDVSESIQKVVGHPLVDFARGEAPNSTAVNL